MADWVPIEGTIAGAMVGLHHCLRCREVEQARTEAAMAMREALDKAIASAVLAEAKWWFDACQSKYQWQRSERIAQLKEK